MEFDFEVIGPIPHGAVVRVGTDLDADAVERFRRLFFIWAIKTHKTWCDQEHSDPIEIVPIVLVGVPDLELLDEDKMRAAGWVRA